MMLVCVNFTVETILYWHDFKLVMCFSGHTDGVTGDVACNGYHKYKVYMKQCQI